MNMFVPTHIFDHWVNIAIWRTKKTHTRSNKNCEWVCLTIPPLFLHTERTRDSATFLFLLIHIPKRSNTYLSSSSSSCFLFPFYKLHCIHLVLFTYLHIYVCDAWAHCDERVSSFVCIMWCMIYVYTFLLLYYAAAFSAAFNISPECACVWVSEKCAKTYDSPYL